MRAGGGSGTKPTNTKVKCMSELAGNGTSDPGRKVQMHALKYPEIIRTEMKGAINDIKVKIVLRGSPGAGLQAWKYGILSFCLTFHRFDM